MADIQLSTSCYLQATCWKYQNKDNSCANNPVFCPRFFRINYLLDQSLLSIKQRTYKHLRIDEDEFYKLDFKFIKDIANDYHSNTLYVLVKLINEEKRKNDNIRRND